MSDLIQIQEEGFLNPGDTEISWHRTLRHKVNGANRRRIIDRERDNGYTPGPDGWLHTVRTLNSHIPSQTFEVHTRIRWEDAKWYAEDPS